LLVGGSGRGPENGGAAEDCEVDVKSRNRGALGIGQLHHQRLCKRLAGDRELAISGDFGELGDVHQDGEGKRGRPGSGAHPHIVSTRGVAEGCHRGDAAVGIGHFLHIAQSDRTRLQDLPGSRRSRQEIAGCIGNFGRQFERKRFPRCAGLAIALKETYSPPPLTVRAVVPSCPPNTRSQEANPLASVMA